MSKNRIELRKTMNEWHIFFKVISRMEDGYPKKQSRWRQVKKAKDEQRLVKPKTNNKITS